MILATVIEILRILLVVLSVPVVWLSAGGFVSFGRGIQSLANGMRSVAFLAAFSAGSFQSRYLLGDEPGAAPSASLLFSQTLTAVSLITALIILLRLRSSRLDQLDIVERHLDVAMAICELSAVAPNRAVIMACECRRELAAALLEKNIG